MISTGTHSATRTGAFVGGSGESVERNYSMLAIMHNVAWQAINMRHTLLLVSAGGCCAGQC